MNQNRGFRTINAGYHKVFKANKLSVGLVVPIENYESSPRPRMVDHIERVRRAEALGFSAVWLRDVPFDISSFGDAGQMFDPFVYLGMLAAETHSIALGVASLILPLRHPAHVAKAAATVDVLSGGRLLLGVASGDRPEEYPAMAVPFEKRGALFRESYDYIRRMSEESPDVQNMHGNVSNMNLLPKPLAGSLPLLITGASQQKREWIAAHGDGWLTFPRPHLGQARVLKNFRAEVEALNPFDMPVVEPLYIDLLQDDNAPSEAIFLGIKVGVRGLKEYLKSRESLGVNHIALNLRFQSHNIEDTLKKLSDELLGDFTHGS